MTIRQDRLKNGLTVVSEHMEGLQSASIGIWVTAGGRHECARENGIAHFLEHMAFKGTTRRSALQIAEAIEDVGGFINAYTSREITAYYARVLKEDVALALDVLADILINPAFDPAEIEVERGVILQEIGQSLDTPDDVVFDWLQEVSYPDQPIGRTILGPAERVSAFSRDDFLSFTGSHYSPERMIVSAAGAIDHDWLVAEAERLFAGLVPARQSPSESAVFKGGARIERHDLEQAHFTFALESPGYRDPGVYTAQIYATVLGGGMSSRLFQEAREKRGLCYSVFAQAGAFEDSGMLTLYSGTSGDDIGALARLCVDEIRRSSEDMSEAEVARARAQIKAGLLMGLENPGARAERMARMVAIWGRVPHVDEVVANIDAVTVDKVATFASGLCGRTRASLVTYGPVEKTPPLDHLLERLSA
ncbi:MAG: M16 family metallopeptidase [Paracoccaceae bacterium]